MSDGERVSDGDRALVRRLDVATVAHLQFHGFVMAHLQEVYHLQPGDEIDGDGMIRRQGAEA